MPADGVVQIAFDRYLLPRSITRQAVTLVDGNDQVVAPGLAPKVTYDPIARTVTLSSPNPPGQPWLTEGQFYKVRLEIAPGEDDDRGLRAIDRAPLDPNQNRVFGFLVGPPSGAPNAERGGDPTVDYCVDIAPIFFTKCNGGTCHGESTGTPTARAGLLLATQRGVAETAIGRLAHGTSTTGSTRPSAPLSEFGVDMPLIDPGNPGNSFLLYKIELAPPPSFDAGGRDPLACPLVVASSTDPDAGEAGVGDAGTSEAGAGTSTTIVPAPPPAGPYRPLSVNLTPADDLERAILSDYIIGREMPYPSANVSVYGQQALTLEEREHLRAWIAQGARLPSAGACKCAPLPAQPFTTATLQAYFSSRCSPCHTSSTSGGLSLNDFQTTTINVPAVGLPSMARITPGDPSQSYLVRKIEGTHRDVGGTGGQMPLGGPALAAGDIDLIKRYVTELATGAGDAGAGDAGADASDAATD
ncbi:MAG: hypothetical protein KC657_22025 [Myxococcales bacterium]|nr:hypothetical protein [Myxococcales bacterium]